MARPKLTMLRPRVQMVDTRVARPLTAPQWADERRGSRHERGYGAAWDRLRKQILERDCGICQPCQREGSLHPATEVDHRICKAEWRLQFGRLDGVDDPSNLEAICHDAHLAKTKEEARRARERARGL